MHTTSHCSENQTSNSTSRSTHAKDNLAMLEPHFLSPYHGKSASSWDISVPSWFFTNISWKRRQGSIKECQRATTEFECALLCLFHVSIRVKRYKSLTTKFSNGFSGTSQSVTQRLVEEGLTFHQLPSFKLQNCDCLIHFRKHG